MVTVWPNNWADILSGASPAVPLPHPISGQTAENSTNAADTTPLTAAGEPTATYDGASGTTAGTEGQAAEREAESCVNTDPESSSPSVPEKEGVLQSMSGRFHAWFHGVERSHTRPSICLWTWWVWVKLGCLGCLCISAVYDC